jgi:hypothetical protein
MKTITVSPQSKTLNDLMKKARRRSLILKSADGEQFVLARVTNLQGFYIGASDDFAEEIKTTRKNKQLMRFLDERTTKAKNRKGVPIADVRKRLRLR